MSTRQLAPFAMGRRSTLGSMTPRAIRRLAGGGRSRHAGKTCSPDKGSCCRLMLAQRRPRKVEKGVAVRRRVGGLAPP